MNVRSQTLRGLLGLVVLAGLGGASACGQQEASRWDKAQQESTNRQAPAATTNVPQGTEAARAGGDLNRFFPEAAGEYDRVAAQEKDGFAEYKLKREGKDVAMLSISDTATNPAAAEKFRRSDRRIAGFPAMEVGTTSTAVLVGNRYQVKVLSRDPSFSRADREAWIQKFDLKGIEGLS